MPVDITALLRVNKYPGRGIVLGASSDGGKRIAAYFIMGRSENSRNRVFEKTRDGIRTAAFDPARLTDPSLVIYHPLRQACGSLVIANGDQSDTICEYLGNGSSYADALMTREYEPDPPIFTPRISGLVRSDGSCSLSILKKAEGEDVHTARYFFEYSGLSAGAGLFLSTYNISRTGNRRADEVGATPKPFAGEPAQVTIDYSSGLSAFANEIWESLDGDNKVSLYVRETDIATGAYDDVIINKHREG
ncbi:MAG: IMP cyclohydrolase [Oscillospiraceae bacterium]|nr:IMP cyclohydrolase [Oscillospiraceae bacterium]